MKNETNYNRTMHNEQNPYLCVSQKLLKDERLSLVEKGIMIMILSNSDDYVFNSSYFKKKTGLGQIKYYEAIEHLIELGYLNKTRTQSGVKWIINETTDENTVTSSISTSPDFKTLEKTTIDNVELNSNNTDSNSTDFNTTDFNTIENRTLISNKIISNKETSNNIINNNNINNNKEISEIEKDDMIKKYNDLVSDKINNRNNVLQKRKIDELSKDEIVEFYIYVESRKEKINKYVYNTLLEVKDKYYKFIN